MFIIIYEYLLELLVYMIGGAGADDPAALYPVSRVWDEVVRVVLTELIRASLESREYTPLRQP